VNYEDTPYNQVSFKASHNSYESSFDIHQLLSADFKEVSNFWCRGIELDFTRHTDGSDGSSASYFQVTHKQGGDGPSLASYLGYLLSWHLNNPGHDPVFVTLCIKSKDGDFTLFPSEMDTYIANWLTREFLFKPSDLMKGGLTLLESVQQFGWPTVRTLSGKMILCLSGTEDWKAHYASSDSDRLCFADVDVSDDNADPVVPADGTRIVANINVHSNTWPKWKTAVDVLRRAGFLTRGYVVNSDELWKKARTANLNAIATDEVKGSGWAVTGPPFVVLA
jgi:hypothetical protein